MTTNITVEEVGFDRRTSKGSRPQPERPAAFQNVDWWIARRFAVTDRYLKTELGSDEALQLLAEIMR